MGGGRVIMKCGVRIDGCKEGYEWLSIDRGVEVHGDGSEDGIE